MAQAEAIRYDVVENFEGVEMRDYPAHIAIEITVRGDRKSTVNTGYRVLGEYLAGKNEPQQKIEMIMPIRQVGDGDLWKLSFSLPLEYRLENAPKPTVSQIKLIDVSEKRFIVAKLGTMASEENINKANQLLMDYVFPNNLKIVSQPIIAFYNPPWALPFFRHNELMIEVRR
jgi:hypothetical protein